MSWPLTFYGLLLGHDRERYKNGWTDRDALWRRADRRGPMKKGKVFPYSLPSVGPGADPGVQAVSPQVTWSESRHRPGSRLPLLSAGPAVTSVAFTCKRQHTSDSSLLFIYRPRKDERLSWLTCSGRFTHISGHPSATGRAQDRESSPVRDRRSTTVPRHQHEPCNNWGAHRRHLANKWVDLAPGGNAGCRYQYCNNLF